jgi:uncharacterized membrane protein
MSLVNRATREDISYYHYNPSLAVSIVAAVLYSITFILTVIQWIRYKAWVWSVMVVAAASMYNSNLIPSSKLTRTSGSCRLYWTLRFRSKCD